MIRERCQCNISTFLVILLVTMCSSSIRNAHANIFDRWTNWGSPIFQRQPGHGSLNGFSVATAPISHQRNSRCSHHSACGEHHYCSCHNNCVSRYGQTCRNGRNSEFDEERFRSRRCSAVTERPGSGCSSNSDCGCWRHCSCHGTCVHTCVYK